MWKLRQISHALWQYLNQPLFSAHIETAWKPSRFWYLYKIEFLEACWARDIGSESHYTQ